MKNTLKMARQKVRFLFFKNFFQRRINAVETFDSIHYLSLSYCLQGHIVSKVIAYEKSMKHVFASLHMHIQMVRFLQQISIL